VAQTLNKNAQDARGVSPGKEDKADLPAGVVKKEYTLRFVYGHGRCGRTQVKVWGVTWIKRF